jgi:hypothetical protein
MWVVAYIDLDFFGLELDGAGPVENRHIQAVLLNQFSDNVFDWSLLQLLRVDIVDCLECRPTMRFDYIADRGALAK